MQPSRLQRAAIHESEENPTVITRSLESALGQVPQWNE
jgi:hypothetical protein